MRIRTFNLLFPLVLLLILTSCRHSSDVMGSGFIHKRKYTGGFYVEHGKREARRPEITLQEEPSVDLVSPKEEIEKNTVSREKTDEIAVAEKETKERSSTIHRPDRRPFKITKTVVEAVGGLFQSPYSAESKLDPYSISHVQKKGRPGKTMGIIAFVFGICGYFISGNILGTTAVVCGIISIRQATKKKRAQQKARAAENKGAPAKKRKSSKGKRKAWRKGKTLAIWGIIMGVLDIIGAILFIILFSGGLIAI